MNERLGLGEVIKAQLVAQPRLCRYLWRPIAMRFSASRCRLTSKSPHPLVSKLRKYSDPGIVGLEQLPGAVGAGYKTKKVTEPTVERVLIGGIQKLRDSGPLRPRLPMKILDDINAAAS